MKRGNSEKNIAELTFYDKLPQETINYEFFKEQAISRLKILRRFENNIKDSTMIKTQEEDLMGHACLSLVSSQAKWSRIWFVNMETQLFKHRIEKDDAEFKKFFEDKFWPHFIIKNDIKIQNKSFFDPELKNNNAFNNDFLIHFSKCSEILHKRYYKMEKGFLKINEEIKKILIINEFKTYLNKKLENLYQKLTDHNDDRLIRLNQEIFSTKPTSEVKDVLSKYESFPLCIKGIIQKLEKQKHLKYNDRQTLCLFFKELGMPLVDTIQYFRSKFLLEADKFNKEYLYAIRHNYGLEGKRANYTSHTCLKIIGNSNEATTFGCPFIKNHDFVKLNSDIEDIDRDALKCCGKVASKIAGVEMDTPLVTPVDYFKFLENNKKQDNEK